MITGIGLGHYYVTAEQSSKKATSPLTKEEEKKEEVLSSSKQDESMGLPLLVNEHHKLPCGFKAKDLVYIKPQFVHSCKKNIKLNRLAAINFEKMCLAAREQGVYLKAVSGYRTRAEQKSLHRASPRYAASPQASEHQTGYAVDVASGEKRLLEVSFKKTRAYQWLKKHAKEFGFIERYPINRVRVTGKPYEPWHYTYVGGKELAIKIEQSGTIEEYVALNNA
jgi:D-alanyl-D-alanine carboxypeptidase